MDDDLIRFTQPHSWERHSAELGQHRYDRHSHDEFSIILVTGGAKTLRVGTNSYTVEPGQIVLVPPGYSHECEPLRSQSWSHRCWYLSPSLAAELLGPGTEPQRLPGFDPVISNDRLAKRLIRSHHLSQASEEGGQDLSQLSLLSEAIQLSRREKDRSRPIRSRARTEAYVSALKTAPAQQLDLEFLADLGGVTRFQVIRDFKAIYHMTPGVYLRDLRLRESRRMLRDDISLADLSQSLGFSDQSHFSRSFKAAYGMSPLAYRNALS